MGGLVGKRRTGRVALGRHGAGGQLGGLDLGQRGAGLALAVQLGIAGQADKDQRGGAKRKQQLFRHRERRSILGTPDFRADTIRQHPAASLQLDFTFMQTKVYCTLRQYARQFDKFYVI